MPTLTLITDSDETTRAVGAAIGQLLAVGAVVLLHGDLGAGKTTLTQGIAKGLGIKDLIQSPTFTLVGEHVGERADNRPIRLYHLDLYRLDGEDDLPSIGWETYLLPEDGVSVIEWPERAGQWLPDEYLLIALNHIGADQRRLTIEAVPTFGTMARMLESLAQTLDARR